MKHKPGLFCVDPNSPPVFVVAPNADVPKPPAAPKPVSGEKRPDEDTMIHVHLYQRELCFSICEIFSLCVIVGPRVAMISLLIVKTSTVS